MVIELLKIFIAISALVWRVSGQTISGQFDCLPAGGFTLCQNLWGASAGVGSQSSTLLNATSSAVAWSTSYNWAQNPNNVKSYANILSNSAKGVQLQNIKSAPTAWNWNYTSQSSGIRADVSYDIWTGVPSSGNPATSASSFEIMIWLSGLGGIQPVGSQKTTGIKLANHTWSLWRGPNANWQVLSFVSQDGDIKNFNADLKDFFDYIVANEGVAPTQFLQAIQTGTEPFVGVANLVTSSYSVSIQS
ncbi:endocellulase [Cyathus striatus]|nr:endocellulase [Cyathus striatus]